MILVCQRCGREIEPESALFGPETIERCRCGCTFLVQQMEIGDMNNE